MSVVLTHNVQVNHTELSAFINPYDPNLTHLAPQAAAGDPAMLSVVDMLVNQQALMVSYVNDFLLMMVVTLMAVPLALLLRKPPGASMSAPAAQHAE